MLLTVLLLVIGIAALIYTLATPAKISIENDKKTAVALAQAKDALIGRAAADSVRPGSLPCPDIDNDGDAESPVAYGGVCPSYIGRFPWKTLGVPDLRDGSGERLWYALTPSFRDHATGGVLNSDTPGQITITGTTPASGVIAIVFSPGAVVGTQVRDTASQNNVANYLEGGNETGIATYTFVTAATTSAFNDRLLAVTGADVMTPVEKRAAREILQLLADYRTGSDCDCYPWADNNWNGTGNSGARYGGIPLVSASPDSWSSAAGYNPPAWLATNQWYKVIYYAVSQRDADGGDSGDPRFTVDTTNNVRVVLITTGPAVTGDNRPSSNWNDYVNDPENTDNLVFFMTPSSTAYGRDRIYWRTSP